MSLLLALAGCLDAWESCADIKHARRHDQL